VVSSFSSFSSRIYGALYVRQGLRASGFEAFCSCSVGGREKKKSQLLLLLLLPQLLLQVLYCITSVQYYK
jgi:hypothetical protein